MKPIVAVLAALTVTLAMQGHASGDPICSVSWVGGTDNRWETAANWSTGQAPIGSDDVCITAPGASVVLEQGVAVRSVTVGAALRVSARSSSIFLVTSTGITVQSGGVLDVTSTGAFASSVHGGTVTNHGTVRLLAGAGGQRAVYAPFVNTGLLQVTAFSAVIDASVDTTIPNSGTIAIAATAALTIGSGDKLVLQDGGTFDLAGGIQSYGGLRLEGGTISGTQLLISLAGTLELATDPGESLSGKVALQNGTVTAKGSVPAGLTLWVISAGGSSSAVDFQPLAGESEVTNRGTIVLDSFTSGRSAELSGLPMVNEGTIRLAGRAGERRLSSTLDNRGTVTVDGDAGLTAAYQGAGPLTNSGTLTVGPGKALDLVGSRTFRQQGTLVLDGSLKADDDTIEILDPRVASAAPITLDSTSTLRFGLAPGTPLDADFVLDGGTNTVVGDVPAQTTLRVLGTAGFASPTTTNRGTILLDATGAPSEIAGGSLVNEGTLTVGESGVDAVYSGSGPLVNRGELTVGTGSSLALQGAQTFRQEGVWNQHGSFVADGDTIEIADPHVTSSHALGITAGSTLRFALGAGTSLPVAFQLSDGTSYVEGDVPSGATLRVLATGSAATASFRAHLGATSAANRGTVVLDATGAGEPRLAGLPLVNHGTVRVAAPAAIAHALDNTADGTLVVEPAAQLDLDTLAGLTGTTLEGGVYDIAGRLRIPSAEVRTNAATLILRDGGELAGGALSNLHTNSGTLSLVGSSLTVAGDLANAGTVRIDSGSLLDAPGGFYTQTGGVTELAGTLSASRVNVDAGTLTGSGTIDGDLRNAAIVAPGTLEVTGGFTQAAGGTLRMRVDGATSASRLVAAGASTLGGTLSVIRDGGYTPAIGDTAELVSGPLSGAFATVTGLGTGRPRHVLDATRTSARIRWADLPGAPGGVTATAASRSANVRWTAAAPNGDPVDGYTITAHPAAGGADVRATAGAAERTKTLTGLVDGTAYDVTVTAANGVGDGAVSTAARVTPVPEPPAPVAEQPAPVAEAPAPVTEEPAPDDRRPAQPRAAEPPRVATPAEARAAATAVLGDLVRRLAAAGPAGLAKGVLVTLRPARPGVYEIAVSMSAPRKKGRKARLILLASGKGLAGRVRIRPTAKGRSVLRRARTLKVIVRTTFTPAGGRAVSAERRLTLKVKPRKRR